MRNLLFITALLFISSCAKKEILLPLLQVKGEHEVYNNSQVWIFFETKNNDTIATINRKNTISTTHWIYNIDKRLPLKLFVKELSELKFKHANSFHSEEGMHDYFSYSDTLHKRVSFLKFDQTYFTTDGSTSKKVLNSNMQPDEYNNLHIFVNQDSFLVNNEVLSENYLSTKMKNLIRQIEGQKQTKIFLNFNEGITYQRYLYIKTLINKLLNETVLLHETEFIYANRIKN